MSLNLSIAMRSPLADPSSPGLSGHRPHEARQLNRAAVLELLRAAPRGRAELSRALGLSKPSLGDVVGGLVADGLVVEGPPTPTLRGRHPAPLTVNPERFAVLGVDLSDHGLHVGLYGATGEPLYARATPLRPGVCGETVYAALRSECLAVLARATAPVAAVGVATPGPVDAGRGVVLNPPNFPSLHGLRLVERLGADLGLPVCLEHDSAAAAAQYLRATGAENFVYILLTEGVGAGLVIGRRVYRGQHGFAAELGRIRLSAEGEGSLEETVGPAGILASYYRLSGRQCDLSQVAALARADDPQAKAIFEAAGRTLGWALSTAVSLLDPALLVLGGPGTAYADCLLPAVRECIRHPAHNPPKIVVDPAPQPTGWGAAECALGAVHRGEIALPALVPRGPGR